MWREKLHFIKLNLIGFLRKEMLSKIIVICFFRYVLSSLILIAVFFYSHYNNTSFMFITNFLLTLLEVFVPIKTELIKFMVLMFFNAHFIIMVFITLLVSYVMNIRYLYCSFIICLSIFINNQIINEKYIKKAHYTSEASNFSVNGAEGAFLLLSILFLSFNVTTMLINFFKNPKNGV